MSIRTGFPAVFLALAAAVALSGVGLGAGAESRQAADALSKKIAAITQKGNQGSKGSPSSVTLTQDELNSWFVYRSPRYLPAGVSKPTVALIGQGSMRGTATLDLEAVARKRSKNPFDPLSYLFGRVPVTVTGVLRTRNGMGRFDVQAADVAGIPVPKTILQELLSYYASSPEQPDGIQLDEAFALPANIQRIDVAPGQMVVVQ
jgi:hypothetical protein